MRKKILYGVLLLMALPLCLYLLGYYQNNRQQPYPTQSQVISQLESSLNWLVNNETELLNQANPMLWWMLYEAHALTGDPRLQQLLDKYQQRFPRIREGAWAPLFGGQPRSYLAAYSVQGLPYYNQHIIYGLNCAADIAEEIPLVAQQNEADFCFQAGYIYRPACVTHQMMGIHFLQQNCGLLQNVEQVSRDLQQSIVTQLTWDFRVVDVYLQRVLMLLVTDGSELLRPVWLQRVLQHQLADGGWAGEVPIVSLGGRSLVFNSRGIGLGPGREQMRGNYHATAQGVLILSYLQAQLRSQ
jgi:hypothetical protein